MCWSVEILDAWNVLSAGVLIVCSYLCQSSTSYNLAQSPFLGGWGELAKIVLFIPRHTHAREDSFCEAAGPLPWQRCCLQPLMSVVSASWHLRNSCLPPASSKSAPFFWLPVSNCYGISSSISAKMSTGNMSCFIGAFLWSKIWIGFSLLDLSITLLYFIIHFFKTLGLGKFPGNL